MMAVQQPPNRGSESWVEKHPNGPKAQGNRPARNRPPRRGNVPEGYSNPLWERASREAYMGYQPQLNYIQRLIEEARAAYKNIALGGQSVFAGAGEALAGLPGQYAQMTADTTSNLQQNLETFFKGIGISPNMPGSESMAAANLYGATGANAFTGLASKNQREMGYGQSAIRENELSNRYFNLNASEDFQDTLKDLYRQKAGTMDQLSNAIFARADALREEQQAKRAEEAERQMMADLMQQMLGGGGDTNVTVDTGNPVPADARDTDNDGTPDVVEDATSRYYSNLPNGDERYWESSWLAKLLDYAKGPASRHGQYPPSKQDIIRAAPEGNGRRRWLRENWEEFVKRSGWTGRENVFTPPTTGWNFNPTPPYTPYW